jgi:hypothetical protein
VRNSKGIQTWKKEVTAMSSTMTVTASCGHEVEVTNARKYKKQRVAKIEGRPCYSCRMPERTVAGACGHTFVLRGRERVARGDLCPSCNERRHFLKWMAKRAARTAAKEVS